MNELQEAKPFVKWAGGKKQLLVQLLAFSPSRFERYFEPFIGGGALFFKLHAEGRVKKSFLNDNNQELITAYQVIKENPSVLIEELSSTRYKNDKDTFYKIRSEEPKDRVKTIARMIYLNKTAFNGLYRLNLKGKFNVPFGRYTNPKILDKENLLAVSKALQTDEITCNDFKDAVKKARKGDFVYFDPPYQPISETSSFTTYTGTPFTENDQKRLADCFKELDKKGCLLMLSNSYTSLIKNLYKDFNQTTVMASRAISCKGEGRGKIKELVITNYPVNKLN